MIVYKAVNKINGKCYVGQTVNTLHKRSMSHIRTAKNKEKDYPFHRALIKYGEDSFEWSVICECNTKKEMDEKESFYIKELKSHVSDNGYNLTLGGEGNLGWIPSEETKRKISEANKGRKCKPFTQEHKEKLSLCQIGKKRPYQMGENNVSCRPEVREKISKALKGKKKPYLAERNKLNRGKTYDEIYGKDKADEIREKKRKNGGRKKKYISNLG